MNQRLPSIYVSSSPIHGLGVFTASNIPVRSVIEVCPIIYLPSEDIPALQKTAINNYYFEWDEDRKGGAIALGYGSIYNHSFQPNACYDIDIKNQRLYILAYRNIVPGEEITINYNGDPASQEPLWFETQKPRS